MQTIKKLKLSLIVGAVTMSLMAGHAVAMDSATAIATNKAECDALMAAIAQEQNKYIGSYLPQSNPGQAISQNSCLMGILNTRINIGTFFNMTNLLDNFLRMAEGAACNAANQAISGAVGSVNQSIGGSLSLPYAGTVGSVGIGTTQSGGSLVNTSGYVNGQAVNNQNAMTVYQQTPGTIAQRTASTAQGAQGTASGVWDKVKSFWQ